MSPTTRSAVRAAPRQDRSIRKARYLPALPLSSPSTSDADDPDDDPAAVPPENPVDPLRRVNVMLQFSGAGMLALGSTLVVSLYVTGPPRLNDMASSSTAVLFMTLLIGCLAVLPSWAGALLILIQRKPAEGMPPHNPRWLRFAALLSFFFAMLYVLAGIVLFVLLEKEESFVSFCMQNISSTTEENCTERYNRAWVIMLAIGVVFIAHIALGFPVYRYTRGPAYGVQLESGFLLEPGKAPPHRRRPLQRRNSRFDSDTDSELERYILRQKSVRSMRSGRSNQGSTRSARELGKERTRGKGEERGQGRGRDEEEQRDEARESTSSRRSRRA